MRLSDLHNARVRTRDGVVIGRVREVHCSGGEITHLGVGAGALKRHLTGHGGGRHIPWKNVIELRSGEVIVARGEGASRR